MNGKELLKAVGYVNEKYVQEAETQTIRKGTNPWMKGAALAACLCIAVLALLHLDPISGENSAAQSTAMAEDRVDSAEDRYLAPQATMCSKDEAEEAEVPSVILRVDAWTEAGFTGTVTELVDTDIFDVGMQLQVVLEAETRAEQKPQEEFQYSAASRQDYAEGSLVQVQFLSYDEETGTIVVNLITPIEEGR